MIRSANFQKTLDIPVSASKHGPERVSVYDLQRGFSRDGEEIFIEVTDQDTDRPKVWYQFDRKGFKIKSVRTNLGTTTTRLGPTEFL